MSLVTYSIITALKIPSSDTLHLSRTFRDEDGFMVTKKEMASASESDNEAEEEAEKEASKKKPESVVKTPEKSSKGKAAAAAAAGNLNAASKKQASIMNFFKKK